MPALLGLSGVVGFAMEAVIGGAIGLDNLTGGAGAAAVFGQGLQQPGVVIACAGGAVALKRRASGIPQAV
jgi:hypothetical protein